MVRLIQPDELKGNEEVKKMLGENAINLLGLGL